MTTDRQNLEEIYLKDKLRLQEILKQLSMEQIRYIVARQECRTDGEAAIAVGISAQTVYKWPDIVNEAARLMACDGIVAATEIRRRNLTKAMIAKVGGLDSNDEKLKQGVATEIIEWAMGKAVQKQEVTGAEGGDLVIQFVTKPEDRTLPEAD
jgi:D-arabinose 1-dehydrogenase-like Zn-dependent alcohol dehydrogenase